MQNNATHVRHKAELHTLVHTDLLHLKVLESKARPTVSKGGVVVLAKSSSLWKSRQDFLSTNIMSSVCEDCLVKMCCLTFAVITVLGGTSLVRRYIVLRKLGGGNFGSVFEVQDTAAEAGKTLACKQIKKTKQGKKDFQQVCLTSSRDHSPGRYRYLILACLCRNFQC